MLPSPRLASLSALPRGNGDAMSKVSSNADDAAPANAVLSGCVDACIGNPQGQLVVTLNGFRHASSAKKREPSRNFM